MARKRKKCYRYYEDRVCIQCGKTFNVRKDQHNKFCGFECYWASMREDKTKICPVCGNVFNKLKKQTYCSRECQGMAKRGKPHPKTNGISKSRDGYIREYVDGKYKMQHRLVMERYLGRELRPDEVVHHKDHDKTNNSIENLELLTSSEHTKLHNYEKFGKAPAEG